MNTPLARLRALWGVGSSSLPGPTSSVVRLCGYRERLVRPGELISREHHERWQERSLIRAIPLHGCVRRVRADELASLPIGPFTGLAPMREDKDVVRVEGTHSIE